MSRSRAMMGDHPVISGGPVSQYKPVLVHVHPGDWEVFTEIYEKGRLSARVRELVKADIDRFTKQETDAQALAGLTEA